MRSFTAVLRNTTVCARLGPRIEKENGLGSDKTRRWCLWIRWTKPNQCALCNVQVYRNVHSAMMRMVKQKHTNCTKVSVTMRIVVGRLTRHRSCLPWHQILGTVAWCSPYARMHYRRAVRALLTSRRELCWGSGDCLILKKQRLLIATILQFVHLKLWPEIILVWLRYVNIVWDFTFWRMNPGVCLVSSRDVGPPEWLWWALDAQVTGITQAFSTV